ncbi:MAG: ATP-binding protein, partial [Ktedonobacterales bacterium]
LGRFPLGEKGVGRFAADKLGAELELITRPADIDQEIVLRVAWHHFDGGAYLDQVENQWEVREPLEFSSQPQGTLVRMRRLRTSWNQELLMRVHDGLAQMTAPNGAVADFGIAFECPEYPDLSGPIINELLDHAPYRLTGQVNENGLFTPDDADIWNAAGSFDARQALRERFTDAGGELRAPVCGPFKLSLHAWDLDTAGLRRASMDRRMRDTLRTSCGVRIYRDGFRVWPYGERDDDWLELNQRRVNNPTLRISNNQVVGFVEITQRDNPDLRDRTSREGMIDTAAYFDLRALVLGVLELLEERRFSTRRETAPAAAPAGEEHDEVLRRVQEARASAAGGAGWLAALQTIEQTYRQQMRDQQTRYEYVARLAGLGLMAERMTNAFADAVTDASAHLQVLRNELAVGANVSNALPARLERQAGYLDTLSGLLDLMEPLYRPSQSSSEPLDVAAVAQDTLALFEAPLQALGVQSAVTQEGSLTAHMDRAHLMQSFLCLIDNALRSLGSSGVSSPELRIHVFSHPRRAGIIVADNGPGVRADQRKLIFQPYFSGRRDGAGLGLHVARDILALYNSTIQLQTPPELLPGASFLILLDRRRIGRAGKSVAATQRRNARSDG